MFVWGPPWKWDDSYQEVSPDSNTLFPMFGPILVKLYKTNRGALYCQEAATVFSSVHLWNVSVCRPLSMCIISSTVHMQVCSCLKFEQPSCSFNFIDMYQRCAHIYQIKYSTSLNTRNRYLVRRYNYKLKVSALCSSRAECLHFNRDLLCDENWKKGQKIRHQSEKSKVHILAISQRNLMLKTKTELKEQWRTNRQSESQNWLFSYRNHLCFCFTQKTIVQSTILSLLFGLMCICLPLPSS